MKVPAAKNDEVLLDQIRRTVLKLPGVTEVSINPSTGSVVAYYDQHKHDDFHRRLEADTKEDLHVCREPARSEVDDMARQIETEAAYLAEHSEAARVVVDFCKGVDRQIKIATGNAVDLKVLLPAGLAVVTFLGLGLEAATPIWLTLGLFSMNHFVEMHAHPGEPAPGKQAPSVSEGAAHKKGGSPPEPARAV